MPSGLRRCREFLTLQISISIVAGAIAAVGSRGRAADAPGEQPVLLQLPSLSVQGAAQPADAGRTCVIVHTGSEKTGEIRLAVTADTWLWKENRNSQGSGLSILLRDARYSQGLFKVDTLGLDRSADLHAAFHFKVGGVERKGQPASFSLHRILTEWTEDATWFKPSPDREATWNGLKPGVDFEAAPFASWTTEVLKDGQVVDIGGLDDAIKAWRDGTWANHGFLLLMNGKATQCTIPAREAALATKSLSVGGDGGGEVIVAPNLPLLRRVLVQADDLFDASLHLTALKPAKGAAAGALTLQVFRALRPISDRALEPGTDFDPQPIASCSVTQPAAAGTTIVISDLADVLRQSLSGEGTELQLLIRASGPKGEAPLLVAGATSKDAPAFEVALRPRAHAELFEQDVKPQPGVYAVMHDGHLFYGGKRLRLWGVVGYPTGDRLVKMGFNAQRVWNPDPRFTKTTPGFYSEESVKRGEPVTYVKGDGSKLDEWDRHFADLKAHGLFVMFASLQNGMPVEPLADDNSFIAPKRDRSFDVADWEEWKKAVLAPKVSFPKMVFVDERLQAIRKRAARNLLAHVNQYTGKPYGQEENIAVYEIFNENGFTKVALEGGFESWPPYFQAKLKKKWNQWLASRYANDTALKAAWGKLDEGESMENGSVKPGPTLANKASYPAVRGADFIHFAIDLTDRFHQDFRAYCRTLAPEGVGVNVAPFSFDTQYRPCLPWNYTNSRADVNSFGMYFWDLKSSLTRPPSAYVIDSNTTEGAATILYETNNSRPDPFRAEYPLKLAALACWQDWDGVFWHYWGHGESDESYLTTPLLYPATTHYWTAVYQENDPVMCASMALGGRIFLGHRVDSAPRPLKAEAGASAIFNFDNYNGVGVGAQTFARGAKIRYEADRKSGITFDGAPPAPQERLSHAVAAGDEIVWDWQNGRLIIDSPTAHAYVGKFSGPFRFRDGIVLSDVSTSFVSFAMVSEDGKPLTGSDASRRIYLTAVSDARNTDFQFNWAVQGGPVEMAKAVLNRGHAPVIVDGVSFSVWFPTLLEARLSQYDFALRQVSDQAVSNSNRVQRQGPTPFMSVLTIDRRGDAAATPQAPAVSSAAHGGDPANGPATHPAAEAGAADAWAPIPAIGWEMDYAAAHEALRKSKLNFSSISALDNTNAPRKTITLSDARLAELFNAPADVEITFAGGRMESVNVTFKQPPPFSQVVSDFNARLGRAVESQTGAQFERSIARWTSAQRGVSVTATESQGTLKILFLRK